MTKGGTDKTTPNLKRQPPLQSKTVPQRKPLVQQNNSFEPEGDQLDEFLGAGAQQAVDKATKKIQGGLEKMGVKINRTKRPTVTRDQQQKNIQQNNSFEPEGDQIDEAIPLAIPAAAAAVGGAAYLINKARQAASSKNRNDATIGKPTIQGAASGIRRRNEMMKKAMDQLK